MSNVELDVRITESLFDCVLIVQLFNEVVSRGHGAAVNPCVCVNTTIQAWVAKNPDTQKGQNLFFSGKPT